MTPAVVVHLMLVTLAALVMAVGIVGSILPVLPGTPLVWISGLGYALLFTAFVPADNLPRHIGLSIVFMLIFTVLTLIGSLTGLVLPSAGGAASGAGWQSSVLSFCLAIIGFFVIPIIGALIGAALGIFIVEYLRERKIDPRTALRNATQRTRGAITGFGVGIAVELGSALIMVALFLVWVGINLVWVQPVA